MGAASACTPFAEGSLPTKDDLKAHRRRLCLKRREMRWQRGTCLAEAPDIQEAAARAVCQAPYLRILAQLGTSVPCYISTQQLAVSLPCKDLTRETPQQHRRN